MACKSESKPAFARSQSRNHGLHAVLYAIDRGRLSSATRRVHFQGALERLGARNQTHLRGPDLSAGVGSISGRVLAQRKLPAIYQCVTGAEGEAERCSGSFRSCGWRILTRLHGRSFTPALSCARFYDAASRLSIVSRMLSSLPRTTVWMLPIRRLASSIVDCIWSRS